MQYLIGHTICYLVNSPRMSCCLCRKLQRLSVVGVESRMRQVLLVCVLLALLGAVICPPPPKPVVDKPEENKQQEADNSQEDDELVGF